MSINNPPSFGEWLRQQLRERKVPVTKFANQLQINEPRLYAMFNNQRGIDDQLFDRLLNQLDCNEQEKQYALTLERRKPLIRGRMQLDKTKKIATRAKIIPRQILKLLSTIDQPISIFDLESICNIVINLGFQPSESLLANIIQEYFRNQPINNLAPSS